LALLYSLFLIGTVSIVVRHLFVQIAVRSILGATRLYTVKYRGGDNIEVSSGIGDAIKALLTYFDGTKIGGAVPNFLLTYALFGFCTMMLTEEPV
jgi:hypothetical protein